MSITFKHIDDNNEGRFIVEYEGQEAGYIKYKWLENGNINANGTLVYDTFKDKKGIKIYPTCPFVVKMFSRMPELNDLLADDYVRP
jgi:predicted GNAT family acetyltransferase